jgi:hypothetical protein
MYGDKFQKTRIRGYRNGLMAIMLIEVDSFKTTIQNRHPLRIYGKDALMLNGVDSYRMTLSRLPLSSCPPGGVGTLLSAGSIVHRAKVPAE